MFSIVNSVPDKVAGLSNFDNCERRNSGELNGHSLTEIPCPPKCTPKQFDDEHQKSRSLDQRECDHHGEKSLLLADRQPRTEYLKMLNEAGKDISNVVTAVSRRGETELLALLDCLMSIRPNQATLDNALCEAARQGQTNCLGILITAGAKKLDAALYCAFLAKKHQVQTVLISKGANDFSLLHNAVSSNSLDDLNDQFISCYINATDKNGRTALHIAIENGSAKSLEKLLETSEVDINIANNNGFTPLHLAVTHGCKEEDATMRETANSVRPLLVKSLVDFKDIKLNKKDQDGSTALHLAAKYADVKTLELLLKADIDVNAKNYNQRTALHNAAQYADKHVIKSLLAAGIDVNAKNNRGFTALHMAASDGRTEAVETLLTDDNIKVDEKTKKGVTALDLAKENKNIMCKKLIKDALKLKSLTHQ